MKVTKKYSHLNGEEYLIVHHNPIYEKILHIIENVDASLFKSKISIYFFLTKKRLKTFICILYLPSMVNRTAH